MEPVTIRIPDDTHRRLRELAEEREESVSAVGRDLVEKGLDYDDLERENARLQNRVETLIDTREEHQELVRYVEEERSLQQRREQRQREREEAGLLTRSKWWLFGRSPAEEEF